MRLFFIKTLLVVGILVSAVVILDPVLLNNVFHFSKTTQNQPVVAVPIQSNTNSQESTPAILRWVYQNLEPVANQVRTSFNQWWETQKINTAKQINQWLAQQQQNILSGVQSQVQNWINTILGVPASPAH